MVATFPRLSQYGKDTGKDFIHFGEKLFLILLFLAIVVYIFVRLFAPYLVKIILGTGYLNAIVNLKILVISLFAVYPVHLVTHTLIALDTPNIYMYISAIGTILNIGLNLVFIPLYGTIGAAWVTVIAKIMVTIFCLTCIRYRFNKTTLAFCPAESYTKGLDYV